MADLNLTNALTNVLVTGAAGRTGALVFQKLLADSRYNPVGVVRTEKSKKKLVKKMGCDPDNVVCSDILSEEVLTESFKKASTPAHSLHECSAQDQAVEHSESINMETIWEDRSSFVSLY